MTLNLPLLYVLWLEECCQISPNKNKSLNLWHVTRILVCCIFDYSATGISDLHQGKTSTVRSSPPNYYCYPSFVLWTFGDHEQNEQNELTTILHTNLYRLGLILFWSRLSGLNLWWLNFGRCFHFGSLSKECAKSLLLGWKVKVHIFWEGHKILRNLHQ